MGFKNLGVVRFRNLGRQLAAMGLWGQGFWLRGVFWGSRRCQVFPVVVRLMEGTVLDLQKIRLWLRALGLGL